MKIEVLGTGCYNCIKLETLLNDALAEIGRSDTEITRISDEHYIRKYMPVDEIPGLVIDGILISTGQVPDRQTLLSWLTQRPESAI